MFGIGLQELICIIIIAIIVLGPEKLLYISYAIGKEHKNIKKIYEDIKGSIYRDISNIKEEIDKDIVKKE
ncbi:MAG: twin-arginine translocase TatA/TatE family subunit [Nitrospirota bacterium]